jgi:hypothetical protein
MIRKMITIAAAIAIPVSAITALGAVVGTGVAAARGGPPASITCAQTGSAVLPKPGLTHDGSLTSKPTDETKATISGTGTECSTKAVKLKIISSTTPCSDPDPAPICTPGDARKPNYYDSAAGYASSAGDIGSSLPIETEDNGTKVWLEYGTSTAESPGGTCGAETGFNLTGNVDNSTQTAAIGTYTDNVCIDNDAGAGTSGDFYLDLLYDVGGPPNPQSTITTLDIGGADSSLVITIP